MRLFRKRADEADTAIDGRGRRPNGPRPTAEQLASAQRVFIVRRQLTAPDHTLRDLARRVERLHIDRLDPERFHVEKSEIAHILRQHADQDERHDNHR